MPFNLLIYINERYNQTTFQPKRKARFKGSPKRRRMICHAVAVYSSTLKAHRITTFDTDSNTIGIDNRASGCFSHVSTDFIGPLRDSNRIVKGFGGSKTSAVKIGTLKWTWLDDQGRSWTHNIPNSFYCPSGGVRLLSPQHFAQQTGDITGTGTTTNGKHVILHWKEKTASLTIPLSPMDNVATFHLAPGYARYHTYCQQAKLDTQQPAVLDEEQIHSLDLPVNATDIRPWANSHQRIDGLRQVKQNVMTSTTKSKLEREFLQLHYSLGHIHPDRMNLMIQQGTLPQRYKGC